MKRRGRRGGGIGRWGLLLTALLAGIALCVNALYTYRSADDLFEAAGYGQAELFMRNLRREVSEGKPPELLLVEFLSENKDMGLLYVDLRDRGGNVILSAGDPAEGECGQLPRGRDSNMCVIGERFRFIARLQPRMGRMMGMEGPLRQRGMFFPEDVILFGGRGPSFVAIEFEPRVWKEIRLRNSLTLAASFVASGLLFASALIFWRMNRKREDDEVRRAEKERLENLGQMTAVLAHEIRNPLAALKGHAQLLEEDLGSEPGGRKAALVVSEAVRLEKLITELLDFARNYTLSRQLVDPVELAMEAAGQVDAARVEVETEQPVGLWSLDAGKVMQVLTNIIRNGVQASPEDSPVTVTVSVRAGELVYSVRDRGEGIAESEFESIFEPFHTTRVKGVGLGLAVAKRFVEAHGGRISARNAQGGGAIFELVFPGNGS